LLQKYVYKKEISNDQERDLILFESFYLSVSCIYISG